MILPMDRCCCVFLPVPVYCGVLLFHHTTAELPEYTDLRDATVWTVPIFRVRENNSQDADFRGSPGADSILSTALSVGPGKRHPVRTCAAGVVVVPDSHFPAL